MASGGAYRGAKMVCCKGGQGWVDDMAVVAVLVVVVEQGKGFAAYMVVEVV